eukprot:1229869-Pyramimonas_sp.AAC.1
MQDYREEAEERRVEPTDSSPCLLPLHRGGGGELGVGLPAFSAHPCIDGHARRLGPQAAHRPAGWRGYGATG